MALPDARGDTRPPVSIAGCGRFLTRELGGARFPHGLGLELVVGARRPPEDLSVRDSKGQLRHRPCPWRLSCNHSLPEGIPQERQDRARATADWQKRADKRLPQRSGRARNPMGIERRRGTCMPNQPPAMPNRLPGAPESRSGPMLNAVCRVLPIGLPTALPGAAFHEKPTPLPSPPSAAPPRRGSGASCRSSWRPRCARTRSCP